MDTAQNNTLKNELFENVRLRLGHQLIDVELDKQHLEVAFKSAIRKYHQMSSNAAEESYAFLKLENNVQEYYLDENVLSVRQIFRRTIGSTAGEGTTDFLPHETGFLQMYMLQAGRVGGFLNYELFAGYQELAARMFGGYINFTFDPVSKRLTIVRKVTGDGENVLLWIYNKKPVFTLLGDYRASKWLEDWTLAESKMILGEGRSKFSTIVGPSGGTTLNGTELKSEAVQEKQELELQLQNYVDGGTPAWFIIG